MGETDIFIRLGVSVLAGLVLGLDRELRGIAAGIRTHAVVSLSSAVITISAIMLFEQMRAQYPGHDGDPLRVIQGLAQAIGFIAAGAIFVSKGDVHNLTSAANLWLAAAVGIAAGAGQYVLLGFAMVLGIILVTGVRVVERWLPGSDKATRE
jgi:putative Mg2+ transporter-C (MgtC) family protein